MMSRHAELTEVGLTHASNVIDVVRCSDAASGTLTFAFVPLNARALPYLPNVRVAFPVVPVLPFPDESVTTVPELSSNENATTNSGTVAGVVSVTTFEYGPRLVAASIART